jgi:hypothetical protein
MEEIDYEGPKRGRRAGGPLEPSRPAGPDAEAASGSAPPDPVGANGRRKQHKGVRRGGRCRARWSTLRLTGRRLGDDAGTGGRAPTCTPMPLRRPRQRGDRHEGRNVYIVPCGAPRPKARAGQRVL